MSMASISSCGSAGAVNGVRKNPAPHRGFNSKAREVLLDSPTQKGKFSRAGSDEEFMRRISAQRQLNRTNSEATSGSQRSQDSPPLSVHHHCSCSTSASVLNGTTPTTTTAADDDGFDNIDELPRAVKQRFRQNIDPHHHRHQCHRYLGDIGKTKSAGDLVRRKHGVPAGGVAALSKAFQQQMNIMKLSSADSDLLCGDECNSTDHQHQHDVESFRSQSLAGINHSSAAASRFSIGSDLGDSQRQSQYEMR